MIVILAGSAVRGSPGPRPRSAERIPSSCRPVLGHDPIQNRDIHIIESGRKIESSRTSPRHANPRTCYDRNYGGQIGFGLVEEQHDTYSATIERVIDANPQRASTAQPMVLVGLAAGKNSGEIPTGFSLKASQRFHCKAKASLRNRLTRTGGEGVSGKRQSFRPHHLRRCGRRTVSGDAGQQALSRLGA